MDEDEVLSSISNKNSKLKELTSQGKEEEPKIEYLRTKIKNSIPEMDHKIEEGSKYQDSVSEEEEKDKVNSDLEFSSPSRNHKREDLKEEIKLPPIYSKRAENFKNSQISLEDFEEHKNDRSEINILSPFEAIKSPSNNSDDENTLEIKTKKNKFKIYILKLLDNFYYTIFMTTVTVYALFGDDIRLLLFSKEVDQYFWAATSGCLIFFTLEIVLSSIARDDYFFKFYFWLDTMATISLISDIGWIWNRVVGNQDFSAGNAQQASQLARAGRGARVGTRAGRIIRIIRLIRLIRVVKLYKHAHVALAEKTERENQDEKTLNHENDGTPNRPERSQSEVKSLVRSENKANTTEKSDIKEDMKIPEESKVGKKLSDLTTKRVIILVLAMMFSIPIFSISTYRNDNNSFKFGLELMDLFSSDPNGAKFQISYDTYLTEHKDIRTPLISLYIEIGGFNKSWDSSSASPNQLRFNEADVATIQDGNYVAIFDLRKNVQLMAALSIGRTLFV